MNGRFIVYYRYSYTRTKEELKDTMSDQPKKINLAEAIRQKLAEKKKEQANQQNTAKGSMETKKLQSQQTKKVNNQRKKMGS